MTLSIIIVNYNVKEFLAQCLNTVREAISQLDAEVIVVDNASSDGSVEMLQTEYPWVTTVAEKTNWGFSRANNIGIRLSHGKYILLLNPDTLVAGDTLIRCINYLEGNLKVGALGTRMFNADGTFALESRRGLPTPFTSFCKMVGLTKLFPHSHTLGRYYMQFLDPHQPHEIEVMSGAFMMIRRSVLDEVGLLDERFFMYGEDIDLSYRIILGGWQNHYVPYPIIHFKGESTQKSSFRYVSVFYNAMLIFYNKHFSDKSRLLTIIVKTAVVCMAAIDFIQRKFWTLMSHIMPAQALVKHKLMTTEELLERIQTGDSLETLMKELREKKVKLGWGKTDTDNDTDTNTVNT